jgi:hypothetical protein
MTYAFALLGYLAVGFVFISFLAHVRSVVIANPKYIGVQTFCWSVVFWPIILTVTGLILGNLALTKWLRVIQGMRHWEELGKTRAPPTYAQLLSAQGVALPKAEVPASKLCQRCSFGIGKHGTETHCQSCKVYA